LVVVVTLTVGSKALESRAVALESFFGQAGVAEETTGGQRPGITRYGFAVCSNP
jgi:hypothetical protein